MNIYRTRTYIAGDWDHDRAIEMKRKHIESNLDDYIFFQSYSFIDENNIEYNICPLGQFQYNGQVYAR